ncbi:MAG: TetR/AcrR family transcriptional regulator [Devosiaceae bacterium]|nr:TetR/AcrR family transcriptional regulator [Devosiaceae bacterium]
MARTLDQNLHKRRKTQIISAAAKCFAKKGIHQTSMQEICDAANISAGALYRYFASKDAVILAMAESEKNANEQLITHLDNSVDVVEGLCQALPSIIAILSNREYGRLAIEISAETSRNPAMAELFQSNDTQLQTAMIKALKAGQKQGTVNKDLNVKGAVYVILAMFDGITLRSTSLASPPKEKTVKSFVYFVRRFLAPV